MAVVAAGRVLRLGGRWSAAASGGPSAQVRAARALRGGRGGAGGLGRVGACVLSPR